MGSRLVGTAVAAGLLTCAASSLGHDAQNAPVGLAKARAAAPRQMEAVGLAGGEHVLIYEELTLGVSAYQDAISDLGWSFTLVDNGADFESELTGPDMYTHVISAHQNTGGAGTWEDDLADWAQSHPGAPVLISDWRVGDPQPYLGDLGFAYTGNTNLTRIEGLAGGLLEGLASDLFSPGWGVFSYGVSGPEIIADDDAGEPMVARNGCWFFNGFLSDTFTDAATGTETVVRQLLCDDVIETRTYESESGPFDISNDLGPTVLTIDVEDHGTIHSFKDVQLIEFMHTWAGDLKITLEHDGVTVTLLDQPGVPESTFGDSADFNGDTYTWIDGGFVYDDDLFDDEVPSDMPYGPIPPSAFDDFAGLDKYGLWTLTITDNAGGDDGEIYAFRITMNNLAVEDCNDNGIPDDEETAPLYDLDPDAEPAPDCDDAPYIGPGILYETTSVTAEALVGGPPELFFCGLLVGVNDVFYKYVACWDGLVFITVEGPPIDWLYGVYDECPPTAESLIACNEIDHFQVIFEAEKGKEYWIRIAGKYFATGPFELYMLGPDAMLNPTDCNRNGIPDECECLADVNGDGYIDSYDLALVLKALGTSCNGCPEDVDGSGFVDETDAMIVIESQGPCPFPDGGV